MRTNRPTYLSDSIVVYKPKRDLRNTSSSSVQLVLGTARNAYGRGSWTVCAARTWNLLPANITSSEKLSVFSHNLEVLLSRLSETGNV